MENFSLPRLGPQVTRALRTASRGSGGWSGILSVVTPPSTLQPCSCLWVLSFFALGLSPESSLNPPCEEPPLHDSRRHVPADTSFFPPAFPSPGPNLLFTVAVLS